MHFQPWSPSRTLWQAAVRFWRLNHLQCVIFGKEKDFTIADAVVLVTRLVHRFLEICIKAQRLTASVEERCKRHEMRASKARKSRNVVVYNILCAQICRPCLAHLTIKRKPCRLLSRTGIAARRAWNLPLFRAVCEQDGEKERRRDGEGKSE